MVRSGRRAFALGLGFASLPTRIIVLVFAVALVTGVAVTLIATGSTEAFLRSKIDERFPQLLRSAAHSLDRWYEQRQLDLATFAASETVVASLAASDPGGRVRDEVRRYLAYVQDGFPHYHALFVLDAKGGRRVSVGGDLELPDPLRESLAAIERNEVSGVLGGLSQRFQVVSAPIRERDRLLGTLHAVVMIDAVEQLLASDENDASVGLYVIGPSATVVARSPGAPERTLFERELPHGGAGPRAEDYYTPGGDHVMGAAVRYGRFDWTLVVEQDYDVAFAPVVSAIRQVLAINIGIVLLFGAIALMIARSIVRPIHALSEGARRIAQGDTSVDIPQEQGQDEIGVLSRALHAMVERLRANQIALQRSNEMLEQLSFTDGLTHLHNHRYFQDRLRIEVRRADRSGESLALLLLDIDDFKALNDRHGHAVGDQVLAGVAAVVNGAVRDTDLPARYGGEEFVVLAPRTDAAGALTLAEMLRQAIATECFQNADQAIPEPLSVTVSIGVALYSGDPKRFFNEADRALYAAKGDGKDCVALFDPQLRDA